MTVAQYLQSGHNFTEIESKVLKRSNTFCKCVFVSLLKIKYIDLINLKTILAENDIIGAIVFLSNLSSRRLTRKKILRANYKDYIYFIFWFLDEFKNINKLNKELDEEPNVDLISAGVEQLRIFEELNIIDALAGGDILKWKQIENLTYEEIYTKLLKTKIEKEIQDTYSEILREKQKK